MKQDSWTLAGMWAALRKLWLVVVIGTILGAAAGLSISLATTPLVARHSIATRLAAMTNCWPALSSDSVPCDLICARR